MALIQHSSKVKPRLYPNTGGSPIDVDRVQNATGSVTQSGTNVYEWGRKPKMAKDLNIPEATWSVQQLEYGTIDFYLALANLSAKPSGGLTLSDFDSSLTDVVWFGKKNNTLAANEQTLWLPKMAVSSIQLNIADAQARIERTVEMKGDDYRILQDGNVYFIYKTVTAPSGTSGNYVIATTDPVPVVDPNNSGIYILRVDRIRAGTTTTLTVTTDYTYTPTNLTILAALTDDEYRLYYSAGSFGTGGDPNSLNDVDDYFLKAENCTVTLDDGNTEVTLDLLTSLSINATFNRIDESVIGNKEKIFKGVESYDVKVSLGGRVDETVSLEKVLMGQAGNTWGIVDVREFITNAILTVKIYSDNTKSTFLLGYQVSGLSFDSTNRNGAANAFLEKPVELSSDNLLITDDIADL